MSGIFREKAKILALVKPVKLCYNVGISLHCLLKSNQYKLSRPVGAGPPLRQQNELSSLWDSFPAEAFFVSGQKSFGGICIGIE